MAVRPVHSEGVWLQLIFLTCFFSRSIDLAFANHNKFVMGILLAVLLLVACVSGSAAQAYTIDDSPGLGRTFDGIGGLSGGGVSTAVPSVCTVLMKLSAPSGNL